MDETNPPLKLEPGWENALSDYLWVNDNVSWESICNIILDFCRDENGNLQEL